MRRCGRGGGGGGVAETHDGTELTGRVYLSEYLHGAHENGRHGFDGVHAAHQDLAVHAVGQLLFPLVNVLGHAGQPRADILEIRAGQGVGETKRIAIMPIADPRDE